MLKQWELEYTNCLEKMYPSKWYVLTKLYDKNVRKSNTLLSLKSDTRHLGIFVYILSQSMPGLLDGGGGFFPFRRLFSIGAVLLSC